MNRTPESLERDRVHGRARRQRERRVIFEHYGTKCACCGEDEFEFLQIAHIDGGGNQHVKTVVKGQGLYRWLIRQGFPEGFRTLCANCNSATARCGVCPHVRHVDRPLDTPPRVVANGWTQERRQKQSERTKRMWIDHGRSLREGLRRGWQKRKTRTAHPANRPRRRNGCFATKTEAGVLNLGGDTLTLKERATELLIADLPRLNDARRLASVGHSIVGELLSAMTGTPRWRTERAVREAVVEIESLARLEKA